MEIRRIGSQASMKGADTSYTGDVRIDPIMLPANDPSRVTCTCVTFEPGARTRWHIHPLGQILIVSSGFGLVQRAGSPVEEIRPGDVVWIAPGERHWHGGTSTTAMVHIAIQEQVDGKTADWLEPVSEDIYASSR